MKLQVWIVPAALAIAVLSGGCASEKVKSGGLEYRTVVRDGQEYFCRTEAVTGSRVSMREVCLTRRQMEQAQEDVRRMQTPPADQDLPDGQPGAY